MRLFDCYHPCCRPVDLAFAVRGSDDDYSDSEGADGVDGDGDVITTSSGLLAREIDADGNVITTGADGADAATGGPSSPCELLSSHAHSLVNTIKRLRCCVTLQHPVSSAVVARLPVAVAWAVAVTVGM